MLLLLTGLCVGAQSGVAALPAEGHSRLAHEAGIRGAVVFQRPDGIYRQNIGSTGAVCLATNGTYPRWSPDGRFVAFVRENRILRVPADGGPAEPLAHVDSPRAVAYHPNAQEVLFTDGEMTRSVSVTSRTVRTVVEGFAFRELDATVDGRQLVATVKGLGFQVRAFDLITGRQWKIAGGCSASLSPDGARVTNNSSDHRKLLLRRWDDGSLAAEVSAPPGRTFDNQFWSNDPDWIASVTDDKTRDVFIHRVSDDRAFQVTTVGDADRPDLFVERKSE